MIRYPYHYIAFFIKSSISQVGRKQCKFGQQKKVQIIISDPCFKTVKTRKCNQEWTIHRHRQHWKQDTKQRQKHTEN